MFGSYIGTRQSLPGMLSICEGEVRGGKGCVRQGPCSKEINSVVQETDVHLSNFGDERSEWNAVGILEGSAHVCTKEPGEFPRSRWQWSRCIHAAF